MYLDNCNTMRTPVLLLSRIEAGGNMAKTTNIRQRKNGLWEGRYRLNGKQCAVYGQTKAEAKAKLAARMTEIEQGICIERTDLTLEEWGWE